MIARMFEADLSAPVVNAGIRTSNPRELSERVAMGRALWRELVVGFASQLGGCASGSPSSPRCTCWPTAA